MNIFKDTYGKSFTAAQMLDDARAELKQLTDSADGTQMHRRAVIGKKLYVKKHNWDAWARDGRGARRVSIRVEGQYTDQTIRTVYSTATAEQLVRELEIELSDNPIGITQ